MDDCTLLLELHATIVPAVLSRRWALVVEAPVEHVACPCLAASAKYDSLRFRLHTVKVLGVLARCRCSLLGQSQVVFSSPFLGGSRCYNCIWSSWSHI
jgi:hypothetical protein